VKDVNNTSGKLGRRTNSPDTRAQIVIASQELFASQGFDKTTMRQIAAKSNVDPALIVHYFKNKQQLFVESVAPLVYVHQVEAIEHALSMTPQNEKGTMLATVFAKMISEEKLRLIILGIFRSAATDEKAAEMLRDFVQKTVLNTVQRHLTGHNPHLRATLVGSQLIGIIVARYIVKIEPLASASAEEIIEYLGPRLQSHFDA